jgi:D-serine deaminase-like pyridoxal phosphate-dependent protein
MTPIADIARLGTPCLLLDEQRMSRNIARLSGRLLSLGVPLRPHLKTAKCLEVARQVMATQAGPAAVSTLKEAEQFAAAGVRDILYTVGITPDKLDRVVALRKTGVDLAIVVDNLQQALAVCAKARETHDPLPVLIEVDSDGHRSGVKVGDALLLALGQMLNCGGTELRGVMTHAGESYKCTGVRALEEAAERERQAAVRSAEILRAAGLPCSVVSVGSTPTALFARSLHGVTEVRAGVFVFFDLVMAGLGVCTVDDIAISVLATVIGHQLEKGWTIVDAGWTAMSRDRGTWNESENRGYGLVCDQAGQALSELILQETSQEHGIIRARTIGRGEELPVGSRVRILPNHACATSAQHDQYFVLDEHQRVTAIWPRFSGW